VGEVVGEGEELALSAQSVGEFGIGAGSCIVEEIQSVVMREERNDGVGHRAQDVRHFLS